MLARCMTHNRIVSTKNNAAAFGSPKPSSPIGVSALAIKAASDLRAQVASPIVRLDAKTTLRPGDGKAQFLPYRPALPND
jgi:hypothetical protein